MCLEIRPKDLNIIPFLGFNSKTFFLCCNNGFPVISLNFQVKMFSESFWFHWLWLFFIDSLGKSWIEKQLFIDCIQYYFDENESKSMTRHWRNYYLSFCFKILWSTKTKMWDSLGILATGEHYRDSTNRTRSK